MKKVILLIALLFNATTLFKTFATTPKFSIKEAPQDVVERMAEDLCKAMELYDPKDQTTIIPSTKAMEGISSKEEGYQNVTEEQLKPVMQKKCPDGYKKLMDLVNGDLE